MKISFKKFLFLLLGCIFILQPSFSFAEKGQLEKKETKEEEVEKLHPILQAFKRNGGRVNYLGHAHGLEGWLVISPEDQMQYIYTTKDGALLRGALFDKDGNSITTEQLSKYKERLTGSQEAIPGADKALKKSLKKSERMYADLEKSNWIKIGNNDAPYIYVLVNIGCKHCQDFWGDLKPAVDLGKLQIRLVPYGSQKENREGGAALLSVKNPGEAWTAYIAGDKKSLKIEKIKDEVLEKIDMNTDFLRRWKLIKHAPPLTFYRRPADSAVTVIVGRPENTMIVLADLLN